MTVIYGLIALGGIIFIHEMGHFIAARLCGVRVEAFSLGMGPVLLHKNWRGTDWRISLIPIGGYCAMKGEQDFAKAYDDGLDGIPAEADSMFGVRPLSRAAIGFAGPLANLLFAVLAYSVVAMTGYTYYAAGNQIRLAHEAYPGAESAAAEAGLQSGDTILSINGQTVTDFADIASIVARHPDEDLAIIVERDGKALPYTVHTTMAENGAGKLGVVGHPESVVRREARRYAFFPAIRQGIKETGMTFALTVKGIGLLFKGAKVSETVSGPARIVTMLGGTVKDGFGAGFRTGLAALLQFTAIISVSLFMMNMLPVPVLDGGLIFFSLVEAVFGISLSPKLRIRVQYIGLALLAALFVVAMAGDITYFARMFHEK